jgi:hypothetical protein
MKKICYLTQKKGLLNHTVKQANIRYVVSHALLSITKDAQHIEE